MKTKTALLLVSALLMAGCNNFIHELIPKEDDDSSAPVSYTVTFNKNGGDTDAVPASATTTHGGTVSLPAAAPGWANHAFGGWWTKNGYGLDWGDPFTASTPVTADITVYAKWNPAPNYYTVTFDKNNSDVGSTEANPNTWGVAAGAAVNPLPTPPARLGYAFIGWYESADGGVTLGAAFTASTPVTANITVYAKWNQLPHYFTFTVRTTTANETFAIPTSGQLWQLNGYSIKPYTWNIDWGDTRSESANGISGDSSPGIAHPYATPGDYRITITPGGSTDAWLGAFGFYSNTNGANAQANKNMVISVDSPLTLLMLRRQDQINAGTALWNEWSYMFYNCQNPAFKMGPAFKFAAEWDTLTRVGTGFARYMFSGCSGAAFTMNTVFNLPSGITTAGPDFAQNMFSSCSGADFTMNTVFNLPPGITTIDTFFAYCLFYRCSGAAFQVNSVFKFPPLLSPGEINKGNAFVSTFASVAAGQTRTATSIINGNPNPGSGQRKTTFGPAGAWSDYNLIDYNWRQ